MATPSDAVIRAVMEKLVPKVNLETMTTKQFIQHLAKSMGGVDLSQKKKFIKVALTEILNSMDDDDDEEDEEASEEESSSSDEEPEPAKKKQRRSGGGGGGLTAVKEISDTLADFLGKGKKMARTEVVKSLWNYIKANDLQNPKDRREILLDQRMQSVFGADRFTMFQMNKYVGAHIHPFTPVDLTKNATPKKKATATRGKNSETKGKKKQGMQAPWRLSEALSNVVEKDILPRPQVTQALWAYIRKHQLQVCYHN